jgi:translocation and assembly module TamB
LKVRDGAFAGAGSIAQMALDATVDGLDARPVVDATLTIDGLRAGGILGSGSLHAKGPEEALVLTLAASVPILAGAPLKLAAVGTLDAVGQRLSLASAQAAWRGKNLRLLAPARIAYAAGVAIDRLRLGLDKAVLEASGPIKPALGITATVRDLPASLVEMFVPGLAADGTIGGEARLTGSLARPDGTIKITATGLRLRQQLGRLLPLARIDANAIFGEGTVRLDVRAAAGTSRLTVTGGAPMGASGRLDLHVAGVFDLGLIDPLLAANGQHIAGSLTVNAGIAGSVAAPSLSGGANLTRGELRDDGLGARLRAIAAQFELTNGTLRVANAMAQAGPGSVRIDGTIGILSPDVPIDLTLTARNAQPLASDALTASMDADLTIRGPAAALTVGGSVRARQVDFRVPEKLPTSVPSIDVRDPGKPPPAPARPGPAVALNVDLEAPNRVFVRGRGMDVELGGSLQLRGTMASPSGSGGLRLRQGTIGFAGQTLRFTRGTIDFNGASLVDPALNLVSTTSRASVAVTLTVSGTPRAPKITLTSVPELPQDEILAQLLFRRSIGALSAIEVAQIAAALASLSGVGPGIENPLNRVRQALGLDRLSAGTTASGGAALEAGRFVLPGVYIGAKQGVSGGSQAIVRFDIGKGLTLQGTAGIGGSATGEGGESNGSGVGVGYEFEY